MSDPYPVYGKSHDPIKNDVRLSALWVGHATVLLQIYDKVIITDPLFSNNVAQVLRRYNEPGIDLDDLEKCDIVLISHSHMDHLDLGAIGDIDKRFPGTALAFPEGVEQYLPDYEMKYHRFDMWDGLSKNFRGETKIIDGVEITSIAANHWGGRYGLDGKLWQKDGYCGYIIKYKDVTVYFAGDTSYDDKFFKYLGANYNIDLAVVPIIYCNDCDEINQGGHHLLPKGILSILDDTKSKLIFPVHYGTFTDPRMQYPVLEKMLLTTDYYKERVKILKLGEQIRIENKFVKESD
jgi:L-ascorbate metabolism protein UlaG (beta-lactamase superfamily)